jgi:hypothetical protein
MIRHIPLALAVVLAIGDCARLLDEEIKAGLSVASQWNHHISESRVFPHLLWQYKQYECRRIIAEFRYKYLRGI